MTMTMHMDGAFVSPDVLAKMPPEARAQMGAAMARMQQPTTTRDCLTAEKLARGFDVNRHHGSNCQQTLLQQTSSKIEMRATCSTGGDSTTVEHGTITAIDNPDSGRRFRHPAHGFPGPDPHDPAIRRQMAGRCLHRQARHALTACCPKLYDLEMFLV